MPKYITVSEAAEILEMDVSRVRQFAADSNLESHTEYDRTGRKIWLLDIGCVNELSRYRKSVARIEAKAKSRLLRWNLVGVRGY